MLCPKERFVVFVFPADSTPGWAPTASPVSWAAYGISGVCRVWCVCAAFRARPDTLAEYTR